MAMVRKEVLPGLVVGPVDATEWNISPEGGTEATPKDLQPLFADEGVDR